MSLAQVIDGLAGVGATIIGAGLPDLQGAHSLVAKHAVAWVVNDGYLVLHPHNLRLQQIVFILKALFKVYSYMTRTPCLPPTLGLARTLQFRVVL